MKIKYYLLTIFAAICWGMSGTFGEYLLNVDHAINSQWLTSVRMLISGTVLLIYIFARHGVTQEHKALLKNKKDLRALVLYAIFGLVACQYTYLTAIAYSNAGTATVFSYLGPIFIVVYFCFYDRRRPNSYESLSVVLALIGTLLLSTHGDLSHLVLTQEGLIWGLLAALGLMLNNLLPTRLIQKYGSSLIVGYGLFIGGLFLTLTFRIWEMSVTLTWDVLVALSGIILIGTVLAFNLYLMGLNKIGAINASLIACLEPVASVFFSSVFLGTRFEALDYVGIAVILVAAVSVAAKDLLPAKKNKA